MTSAERESAKVNRGWHGVDTYPANQSKLHVELAERSLRWLRARATKSGVVGATEVGIARGYVADAVALASLQWRFLNHYMSESGFTRPDMHTGFGGWRDEAGAEVLTEFAWVFEAKATRPDFLATFGGRGKKHVNRHTPIGSLHWCVVPKNLGDVRELPAFWGLLEMCGQGLRVVRIARVFNVSQGLIHRFGYEILKRGRRTS